MVSNSSKANDLSKSKLNPIFSSEILLEANFADRQEEQLLSLRLLNQDHQMLETDNVLNILPLKERGMHETKSFYILL